MFWISILTGSLPVRPYYHHDRPEWAIITPERFQQAQEILEQRRKQYATEYTHFTGRYSNRHLFSTLIRCKECGRAFSRRVTHYPNSDYIYWRCPTNNQYTAKRCSNNTIVREDDLIETLSTYLREVVSNKESIAQEIARKFKEANAVEGSKPDAQTLEAKKVKLKAKLEKYMEMYANDVITMEALKSKTAEINESINVIDDQLILLEGQRTQERTIESITNEAMTEIERFLSLQSATNMDLRRIIDSIIVDDKKQVKINLKITGNL